MQDQVPFAKYVRKTMKQLSVLVVIECLAFTVVFAFSATNPMFIMETGQVLPINGSFKIIVALSAVVGLVGMIALSKSVIQFMSASDEFVDLERLAILGKFSTWAAHQIRNPLAVIKGQTQILMLHTQNPQTQKSYAQIIKQADKVSDLLSLMMALSQPVLLHKEQVDIPAMLALILESYVGTYSHIEFSLSGAINGIVVGHPGLLEEAFKNVITNAIESIDGSGHVDVVCSESISTASIEIRDSGPGISDEALSSAFELGFTTKRHGNGLGLPIVRSILGAHKGNVVIDRVRGTRQEHGTVVTLEIPKAGL